jgi:hypothetical protein
MTYTKGDRVIVTLPSVNGPVEEWATITGRDIWMYRNEEAPKEHRFYEVLLDADSPWISGPKDDGRRLFNEDAFRPFYH